MHSTTVHCALLKCTELPPTASFRTSYYINHNSQMLGHGFSSDINQGPVGWQLEYEEGYDIFDTKDLGIQTEPTTKALDQASFWHDQVRFFSFFPLRKWFLILRNSVTC